MRSELETSPTSKHAEVFRFLFAMSIFIFRFLFVAVHSPRDRAVPRHHFRKCGDAILGVIFGRRVNVKAPYP